LATTIAIIVLFFSAEKELAANIRLNEQTTVSFMLCRLPLSIEISSLLNLNGRLFQWVISQSKQPSIILK
jgi:hypothetical protein